MKNLYYLFIYIQISRNIKYSKQPIHIILFPQWYYWGNSNRIDINNNTDMTTTASDAVTSETSINTTMYDDTKEEPDIPGFGLWVGGTTSRDPLTNITMRMWTDNAILSYLIWRSGNIIIMFMSHPGGPRVIHYIACPVQGTSHNTCPAHQRDDTFQIYIPILIFGITQFLKSDSNT